MIKENETKKIIQMDATNFKKDEFKKEVKDIFSKSNIIFRDKIHNISIETYGEKECFRVSKLFEDGTINYDNGIYKIRNEEDFMDLLFHFKSEYLSKFGRDLKAELEIFYETLPKIEKDRLIIGLKEEKYLFNRAKRK